jgi:starch synthase
MKILFTASEAVPFAKTGGLADVAGSLPPALAALGHDVRLVVPRYGCVARKGLKHVASFAVPLGSWHERCDVLEGRLGRDVVVYFIEKDAYFDRSEFYQNKLGDFPDNAERFIFFSRAVLELCRALDFAPDIVHNHDWQTGLSSFFLRTAYRGVTQFERTRNVFTIHNLGYQGNFWHWDMRYLGDAWQYFNPEGFEFWGNISFLKAGLVYSDIITTVSRTYSREIQTPEYGLGLEGVLARRAPDLYGIVNGIDYDEWDPARDGTLARKFSAARPAGKKDCKKALQKRLKLHVTDAPLIGMVTRLVDQKGMDILTETLPDLMDLGGQFVVLGTGEAKYHAFLTEAAAQYQGRMGVLLKYDEAVAKGIYAGSDLFLMPSRYEPCGLSQLIALRYGSVPVVRKTGGLSDTVSNYHARTGRGTGFVFEEYEPEALLDALGRALHLYQDAPKWKALMRTCMEQDFSWENSAKEYEKVYRKALKKKYLL